MTMNKHQLTKDRLKEVLSYDPATGVFVWVMRGRGIRHGSVAGSIDRNGYRRIRFDGVQHYAQRLAWLWCHGTMPRLIRFQNHDKSDCRIANLQEGFYSVTKFDHSSKEGRAAYQASYRSVRRDHYRSQERQRKFGVDLRQYEGMFLAQEGKCAICRQAETATRKGKPISLAVDHDHSTGAVRELLCAACNKMIGLANEKCDTLLSAVRYLDKHSDVNPSVVKLERKA